MENGIEALNIASSVLIFVLAITVTISVFTVAVQALNNIFDMQNDDEYVTVTDENGNEYYLNYVRFDGGTREVGVETIVPAIYRAYKENYAIYFYESDGTPLVLYEKEIGGKIIEVNYIDALRENEELKLGGDTTVRVNELLYGERCNSTLESTLYTYLQNNTFIEKLGEYYMNDITGGSETSEVNKTKKRVIAYTLST